MVTLFIVLVGLVLLVSVVSVFFADKVATALPFLATPIYWVKSAVMVVVSPVVTAYNWVVALVSSLVAKVKNLL